MSGELPEPLVPAGVDLRDFGFLPLEGRRLLTSDTWILGGAHARCAALCLLIESWYQVPAASLPSNDAVLRHLSQAGARWPKVQAHALRGWVACSDGRLYHSVLAEKAKDAWERKQAQRARTAAARAARLQHAQQQAGAASDTGSAADPVATSVTEDVTSSKGQGQGQGQGQGKKENPKPTVGLAPDDVGDAQGATAKKRQQARQIARRAIEYLNERAGTRFQPVEATLKLPAARVLYDGATEADLRAVVDAKVAEAERGEFDRKYLRPATLFNAEKFAGYVGQVHARPPAAPRRDEQAAVYSVNEAGEQHHITDWPAGEPADVARAVWAKYRGVQWLTSCRNVVVRANGAQSVFSRRELEATAQ